jgi:(1->4)-alpha-D-glucan 1-alpha-D-glucosylmutase
MRRPISTYRLQLTDGFGFRDAAHVVPYLHELGISDVYLSPPFASVPGSTHGYDVVDHNTLRPELGGEAGYAELCAAIRKHGMGQLIDFVPNHMGIGPANAWWMDVLENGPSSVYAPFFDVDWKPVKDELENKVLVPVLGDQYGEVLERGELKLERDGGAFLLAHWDHRFPIAPRHVPAILTHRIETLTAELGETDEHLQELLSIVTALEKLAPRHEVDAEKVAERAREKEVAKRRLAALFEASPRIRAFVDENVRALNGTPGDPRSFDGLDDLLEHQAYRLAHWRVAGEEINYRRFFDINSLAAIRMEDERVFEETHRLVFRLIAEGHVTGLRIDHPDGLYTPSAYFRRLQAHGPLYVVVEKILEAHEKMPASWQVAGTTGYEFLACANGLFVDGDNRQAFDDLYARFAGEMDFRELVYANKKALMRSSMASEMNVLSHRLNRLSEGNRRTRDFTLNALGQALTEYVARLPIYRTYVEGTGSASIEARDRQYIDHTLAGAKRAAKELSRTIFDFLRDVLLLKDPTPDSVEFVRKLQQVTGSVTAKSIEDTAFYVYNRLASLNEVGADPRSFGCTPEHFHALNQHRLAHWPGSLNATSTHDTKRAEDVRLRIDALSEIPVEWEQRMMRWSHLATPYRRTLDEAPAPDANDELLVYQTLIGTLPDDAHVTDEYVARVQAYLEKAVKEAKVHSSWTNPDEDYEAALKSFATGLLTSRPFLDDFVPLERRIAHAARLSGLAQVALKLASPGVTDVYQGCELWDLSTVDPDNRRPVDFARRRALLDALRRRVAEGAQARLELAREVAQPAALVDGRAKLLLLREGLRYRRAQPALFLDGSYQPLAAEGPLARHVVAFVRAHEHRRLVCVVPRLTLTLVDRAGSAAIVWEGRLPLPADASGAFLDVVTGRTLQPKDGALVLRDLFADFPVALLRSAD